MRIPLLISLCFLFTLSAEQEPAALNLNPKQWTLEEKIGQMLVVHFNGTELNAEAKGYIQDLHVGGFIFYEWSNQLSSPQQVQKLTSGLQAFAKEHASQPIPLFMMTDQEGGVVSRLKNGFTQFPGNRALAQSNRPELAELSAYIIGREMRVVGMNMNLAPVVDVNINPLNPVIGIRSFGDSAEQVSCYAAQSLKGYRRAGVIAVLKHFPGHGDVVADSHESLPVVNKTLQELEQTELSPFFRLTPDAPGVMTAHLLVPALDKKNCATLSKPIVEGLLRERMGFQGVILTDSLAMQGVLDNKSDSIQEVAIQSIEAGHDILLLGGNQLLTSENPELTLEDVSKIAQAIAQAVRTGRLSMERIDASMERILTLKNQYALFDESPVDVASLASLNSAAHRAVAREIAMAVIIVVQDQLDEDYTLEKKKIGLFAPEVVKSAVMATSLKDAQKLFFNLKDVSEDQIAQAKKIAQEADVLVFLSYNAWKFPCQLELFKALQSMQKPTIVLVIRDPQDAALYVDASLVICTYSSVKVSIQAGIDVLKNRERSNRK